LSKSLLMAILFPLLSIIIITAFAGGLGVTFMLLEHYMHSETGILILGSSLVVGVPTIAALIQKKIEKSE